MKCLEDYTIEQVKEMSFEELKVLYENMAKEKWMTETKQTVIDILDVMSANKSVIEN